MPAPRVGHCIFCDDIRFEAGNKFSLMGIYQTDVAIDQEFPVLLPRFCIAVWLICDVADIPPKFNIVVLLPDDTELLRLEKIGSDIPINELNRDGTVKVILSQAIPISPLLLPCEGMLQVYIEMEDGKIRVGRVWIHKNETAPLA